MSFSREKCFVRFLQLLNSAQLQFLSIEVKFKDS